MTPARYAQIKQIFVAAARLDVSQRAAYLEQACLDNAELRGEVERLLRYHHDDTLDSTTRTSNDATDSQLDSDELEADRDFRPGTLIGDRYRIVAPLGKGGDENLELENYSGLGFKHPALALCMTIFLLSLGGMPPLAGFVAKFYIFSAALKEGLVTLVILAVLNSAISFYYYLKVTVYMYMREPQKEFNTQWGPMTVLVVVIALIGTIQLGLFPGPFITLTEY